MTMRCWMIVLLSPMAARAFLFNAFTAYPSLQELAKVETDTQLDIRLDIGNQNENHLFLDGLAIERRQTTAASNSVNMPGADGPHPKTSSGKRELHVASLPFYIGMNGKEQVKLEKGAWEMIWKADDRQGSLIFGFENHGHVSRNTHSARLPSGRIYLSFPVWTQALLSTAQEKKALAFERRDEHAMEKDRFLSEMQATNNIFHKLLLYRDAAESFEKMDLTGWRWYQLIPDKDGVIAMGDDILVGQEGTVWAKGFDRFSPKKIVGKATLRVNQRGPANDGLRP